MAMAQDRGNNRTETGRGDVKMGCTPLRGWAGRLAAFVHGDPQDALPGAAPRFRPLAGVDVGAAGIGIGVVGEAIVSSSRHAPAKRERSDQRCDHFHEISYSCVCFSGLAPALRDGMTARESQVSKCFKVLLKGAGWRCRDSNDNAASRREGRA
ncbi:hypothetical protein [Aurantiacibacter xanthus]|uniref:hypothetical protein n=1 Tax=Aurantiacibacter xanthus TaxID=1784712 RepID=UPI001FE67CD8|nr:hypothetical protein [Aurantiacibacter xanthus]